VKQKLIVLERYDGKYGNFFKAPGSINSLQKFLDDGWYVKDMHLDKENERGWVLLENINLDTAVELKGDEK
jgi:hypothetical protein